MSTKSNGQICRINDFPGRESNLSTTGWNWQEKLKVMSPKRMQVVPFNWYTAFFAYQKPEQSLWMPSCPPRVRLDDHNNDHKSRDPVLFLNCCLPSTIIPSLSIFCVETRCSSANVGFSWTYVNRLRICSPFTCIYRRFKTSQNRQSRSCQFEISEQL